MDSSVYIMVDISYYTFIQTHRMYNTKTEVWCELWTLGNNDRFIDSNKTSGGEVLLTEEAVHVWAQGVYGKSLYLQLNFAVKQRLLWKHKFFTCASSVAQSCLTLGGPMGCSQPGSCQSPPPSRIFKAGILGWGTTAYSRASSWPRNRTCISCISCTDRQIL